MLGSGKVPGVCLVVSDDFTLIGAIESDEIDSIIQASGPLATVWGLGFVGLTLAVHLSSRGCTVLGVDVNSEIVRELSKGSSPRVVEPGLTTLLQEGLRSGDLIIDSHVGTYKSRVHIITVGTPVSPAQADLSAPAFGKIGRCSLKGW